MKTLVISDDYIIHSIACQIAGRADGNATTLYHYTTDQLLVASHNAVDIATTFSADGQFIVSFKFSDNSTLAFVVSGNPKDSFDSDKEYDLGNPKP